MKINNEKDLQIAINNEWKNNEEINSAHIIFNKDNKKEFILRIVSNKGVSTYIIENKLKLSRLCYNEFIYSKVDLFVGNGETEHKMDY